MYNYNKKGGQGVISEEQTRARSRARTRIRARLMRVYIIWCVNRV